MVMSSLTFPATTLKAALVRVKRGPPYGSPLGGAPRLLPAPSTSLRSAAWQSLRILLAAQPHSDDDARLHLHRAKANRRRPALWWASGWKSGRTQRAEDLAIQWLNKAYEERNPLLAYAKVMFYDGLRSDPRFQVLLKRIGL
jgi:hypothetical protein